MKNIASAFDGQVLKEGIRSIFMNSKGRAQRFNPSTFCGSLFKPVANRRAARLIEKETLKKRISNIES